MEKEGRNKTLQNFTTKKEKGHPIDQPTGDAFTLKFRHLMTLKGAEYDKVYGEIEGGMNETGRTILRDRNFLLIQEELIKFVRNNQKGLPTVTQLSLMTNLSRVTVGKHLKEMLGGDLEEERKLQHKYLFDVILTMIGRKAIGGDIKFMKLYMDTMIRLEEKDSIKTYIQNQQNNIVVSTEK